MYESKTYENLLRAKIEFIQDAAKQQGIALDTRTASMIYFATAANALETSQAYIELDQVLNESFADTQSRDFLIRRARERGIFVEPATFAIRRGEFNLSIPLGSRFSLNKLNYIADAEIDGEAKAFQMRCETPGNAGNLESGNLIPIDHIDGLTFARLTDVLIPGEDEEATEHLRQRYFASLNAQAYGGNIQDYVEKTLALDGVGAVKVYPAFSGGYWPLDLALPAGAASWVTSLSGSTEQKNWIKRVHDMISAGVVTVGGGTVRLVILDSQFQTPSGALIDAVQTALDPIPNQGEGLGAAPIGHRVTVIGAKSDTVNVQLNITFQAGWNWTVLEPEVKKAIDEYFYELAAGWDRVDWRNDRNASSVVRVSQIETRILHIAGVIDVQNTLLNGSPANLVLDKDSIAVRGAVTNV